MVGGGLSGLAAAFRLIELSAEAKRPLELTVIESGRRLGGIIETRRIGQYLVETGADSFITNKPWAVDLCERLGIAGQLIPTDAAFRRSLVLRNGRPVAVPDGFMLLSPTKLGPVLTSSIFSLRGKLRLGLEYFVPRHREKGDESLASFVRRRFGHEALERLVQPLVGGIYTADPEKLSLRATMPRFLEMEHRYRSLIRASKKQAMHRPTAEQDESGARYTLFLTLAGGLSELLDELERRVRQSAAVRLETGVLQIAKPPADDRGDSAPGWTLTLVGGSTETFDAVVLSLRSYLSAELLGPVDPQLSEQLRQIPYASSVVVVSGHRLSDIGHPLDAFGLVIPHIERRKILAISFGSRKFPGRAPEGRVLLRTFVGGDMQPELVEHSDEEILELVRAELSDILGVRGSTDFEIVSRFENAMPQYHVGHLELVSEIERRLAEHAGLALAGNAYHGVGIPDSIHSGERAAEALFETVLDTN